MKQLTQIVENVKTEGETKEYESVLDRKRSWK